MPAQAPAGTVQYFYSLASPWAYLGVKELGAICARAGLAIDAVPISTFKDNGWVPLAEKPRVRQDYVLADLKRWVKRRGIAMITGADRPAGMANLADALPMIWAAQITGADALTLATILQKAYWEDLADAGLREVRAEIASGAGFDGAALAAIEDSPEVSAERDRMFAAARAAGVFGSPTYIYQDKMFWGQDRLDFLAEAIAGARGA